MKTVGRILGVLLVFVGCVWLLQGIGVLPGSFMSGQKRWAIYGAITVVVGAVILWLTGRRRI